MKRRIIIAIISIALAISGIAVAATNTNVVNVKGYIKKNGSVIAPYVRTAPNATKEDNFSAPTNKAEPKKQAEPKKPKSTVAPKESAIAKFTEPKVTKESAAAKFVTPENKPGYGVISEKTGKPRTHWVKGYTKKDGTVVAGYWRS